MVMGIPTGLLALAGATAPFSGGQQPLNFGSALAGSLGAIQQGQQAQSQQRDRQLSQMLELAQFEREVRAAEAEAAQRQAQQREAAELRQELPQELRQLFDVDQETAIARAFPEPPDPTSLQRNLQSAGIQPGTPQYQQAVLDTITKRRQGESAAAAAKAQEAALVKQSKEDVDAQIGFNKFLGAVQQHRENLQQYGATPFGEGKVRLESSMTALRAGIKEAQALGAYDEGVRKLLEDMVSDPTGMSQLLTDPIKTIFGQPDTGEAGLIQLNELEKAARATREATRLPSSTRAPAPGNQQGQYSQEDLEFTAKKHGITVDEVLQRLGSQ